MSKILLFPECVYGVNLCSRSNQDKGNCFFLEAKKLSCQVMILTWHLKWERPMMNSLKSTSPLPSSSKMSMTRLKSHDIQCQLSFQSFLLFKQGGSWQHFCAWRYCGAMDKLFGLSSWGGAFLGEAKRI